MLKIDNSLLEEIGLGSLPEAEKNSFLKHVYETLEMRVGIRLADQMTNEQLDEFERYFEAKDDAGAFKWLETNFPNYKDIVQQEFDKLKGEVAQTAPQILAASQVAAAQPAPTQTMPAQPVPPAPTSAATSQPWQSGQPMDPPQQTQAQTPLEYQTASGPSPGTTPQPPPAWPGPPPSAAPAPTPSQPQPQPPQYTPPQPPQPPPASPQP